MLSRLKNRLRLERRVRQGLREALTSRARIALFHDFSPPPTGGGHQFLRALKAEWERQGVGVAVNCLPKTAEAVLINSYNFTPQLLRRLKDREVRVVHRLDGPLQVYRGFDDGMDSLIADLNQEFASASVFQSKFSQEENRKLGFELAEGPVIYNAADPAVFRRKESRTLTASSPIRVVAASWSDNPNKGLDVFQWIDANLDSSRFEFTFIGRVQMKFRNCRHISALPSGELAEELIGHDIFLTASKNDPCSNSVVEALTVGLPCVFRRSGGHPELVGEAGVGFERAEEIPAALEKVASQLEDYRKRVRVPSIEDVASRYLGIMKVRA